MEENWLDDYAAVPELDQYDSTMLVADDAEELQESYEKRVRDRLAAEEALDAMDMKRKERDFEAERNLERINRFEQQELDEDEIEEELEEGESLIKSVIKSVTHSIASLSSFIFVHVH